MDINANARNTMNRWRNSVKSKERRIFRFDERVLLKLDAIQAKMVIDQEPLLNWEIQQVYFREIGQYENIDPDWRPFQVGDVWGGEDVSAFFKRKVTVPQRMAGNKVILRLYLGGDSLLKVNGIPYHGLDPFRDSVLLTEHAQGNETFQLDVESFVHWHTGEKDFNVFQLAELVCIDDDVEAAYWDFVAAFKVLAINDIDGRLESFLAKNLWDALLAVPLHEPDFNQFKEGLLAAQAQLRQTVYESDRFKGAGLLHLVGHSHLDLVFMWPYREYIRKVGRTHATMLRLMEQFPDFQFSQSSAKIYADMKTHYPDIYAQVKERVKEGRWQPIGAFWIEPDCNLISGESMVRQILYGQQFWQEEFGLTSQTCWQPDVFGMTWAMPQILKRSGINYVMTNKFFVWNDTNRWRKNTFWWEGPDGSRVLTVIPPGHFIGMVDPDHMDNHWRDFSDKETIGESLYCYGWGDGGGGVDPEMLECARRYQDFPGLIPTKFSQPEEALIRIGQRAAQNDIPVWRDEMYLEAHRGTFTNKGRLKKLNRQSELLYRETELLAALAWLDHGTYDSEKLDEGWRMLLTTQFHDSLPGTHINEVYPMLLDEYDQLQGIAHDVRQEAADSLFGSKTGEQLLIFNSRLRACQGVATISENDVGDKYLAALGQQPIENLDDSKSLLVQLPEIFLGVGWRTLALVDKPPEESSPNLVSVSNNPHQLENQYLRATFNERGELLSLWDKEDEREVMLSGEVGNLFQLYEDKPGKYDAWDIVASYTEHELPLGGESSLVIDETGPLRASLKLTRRFYDSTIIQRISLTAVSRQLTFETKIEWHERQRLLKVGFPLNINADSATYDMAYGNIERPTHRNTPFDEARFEVPAHWWMDMSQADYGVALLNNCKYGHEANGRLMRLTLLKGSIYPDPEADRETHYFTYALYPHKGGWREAKVHQEATKLNQPLWVKRVGETAVSHQFLYCPAENIFLEAMKRSEDGSALIIRLVERHNMLTRTTLTFDRPLIAAQSCDLMENIEKELTPNDRQLNITLNPYEIVTLRIELKGE